MAESLRSGLGSVEKTQIEAAAAAQERYLFCRTHCEGSRGEG